MQYVIKSKALKSPDSKSYRYLDMCDEDESGMRITYMVKVITVGGTIVFKFYRESACNEFLDGIKENSYSAPLTADWYSEFSAKEKAF